MTLSSTPSIPQKLKLLAVDDERTIHLTLQMILKDEFHLTCVSTAQAAMEFLYREAREDRPGGGIDAVILDISMPEVTGIELLKIIRQRHPHLPVVMLTGNTDLRSIVGAMKAGASEYVVKGSEDLEIELKFRIHQAIEKQGLQVENKRLEKKLGEQMRRYEIVGHSRAILKLKSDILKLKGHPASVLITGESGVGKEMVAGSLSLQENDGLSRPFIAVNCAAISENLVESELFGHEKGAFTGAINKSKGKFLAAHRGDIFLDEIGDMPLAAQAKLLRTLQERVITPVGSTESIPIDVRVIAATNKDLKAEIQAGRFREDLYYRLSVVRFEVPPLRERREDIPVLAEHFLKQFGADKIRLTDEAVHKLQAHSWRGNIRVLRNCLERAWILTRGEDRTVIDRDEIQFDDISATTTSSGGVPTDLLPQTEPELSAEKYERFTAWSENIFFKAAFVAAGTNKTRLAERLGLSRDFIHRKLKTLKIGQNEEELLQ